MAVPICTTASTMTCPHGGTIILTTSNAKMKVQGAFALLVTDVHIVAGCPFAVGPKYQPCVTVRWSAGATETNVDGTPVLIQTSIGTCYSVEQIPQGVAVIAQVQPNAKGL
jgi:hypothetical protein